MVFVNEKYEITIKKALNYSVDSADNKHYDKCIQVNDTDVYEPYTCYEMEVFSFQKGESFSIVFLASYCAKVFENSGILTEDIFYLILDSRIVRMDLKDGSYVMYTIAKPFGTYYEIYDCDRGFLVYGEIELVLLDKGGKEQWRYCTQDILYSEKALQLGEDAICFTDLEGNYHEVDWSGNQRKYVKHEPKIVTINMKNIKTPLEFQNAIKQMLGMPDFYGRNWDAYWDAITGLITLPDELILDGWHMYKSIQKEDAITFEGIMKDYNALKEWKSCECVYKRYE